MGDLYLVRATDVAHGVTHVSERALGAGRIDLAGWKVPGVSGIVHVVCGNTTTCAMRSDGAVLCWGSNGSGMTCDGTTTGHGPASMMPPPPP